MKIDQAKQERMRITDALASRRLPQLEAEPCVKDPIKQIEDKMTKERGKEPPHTKWLE